jgi:hypothetical protein
VSCVPILDYKKPDPVKWKKLGWSFRIALAPVAFGMILGATVIVWHGWVGLSNFWALLPMLLCGTVFSMMVITGRQ